MRFLVIVRKYLKYNFYLKYLRFIFINLNFIKAWAKKILTLNKIIKIN